MGELGSPFSAGRDDFLLLLLLVLFTRAVVFFILLTIRLPLLLTFTSTSLLLFDLFLRPVGHRVHLSDDLENSKQSKSQSTKS